MLLESQFGHVFWNGNHPGHQGNFHPYRTFPIPPWVLESHNDAEITSELLSMGIDNVIRDPEQFLLLTVTRLRELFKFWPTSDSTTQANFLRLFSFGLLVPFAAIGILLSLRIRGFLAPVYLFLVAHIGVYSVSWTMIRYRIPVDAFLIMFGAYTVHLGRRLVHTRRSSQPGYAS
jgi:hypothetical protein